MSPYFTVNTISEFCCFFISMLCITKDKLPVWRAFVLFLLLTCIIESIGVYVRHKLHQPNFMVYNLFLLVECVVLNYFFYHIIGFYHNYKNALTVWFTIFSVFFFAELIVSRFGAYLQASSLLMSVELIMVSVYYYYLLVKEEKYRQLSTYAPFWWVNGTVIFYFGGIASNIFFSYLIKDQATGVSHSARYLIFTVLNVFLYSCWSYSFLCRYRQRNSFS
jgi:hypothetical protein